VSKPLRPASTQPRPFQQRHPLTQPSLAHPRRRNRDTIAERDKQLDPEVIEARRVAEAEQRKKEAHDLVAESIVRELAASKRHPRSARSISPRLSAC